MSTFFTITSSGNESAISTNGITWTAGTLSTSQDWYGIASTGSVICAVGAGSSSATSTDGLTWTTRTMPTADTWRPLLWNGTVFCSLAIYTTNSATSPDGITWSSGTLPSSENWTALAWNGTVFCAVAVTTSAAATSTDGLTWTARTMPASDDWSDIIWNGTTFCAISPSAAATSTDGITWSSASHLLTDASAISWNGSIFCITGDGVDTATSPDGVTWTLHTGALTGCGALFWSLAWNGSVFCAVSADISNDTATSPDGITWTSGTLPITTYWGKVTAAPTGSSSSYSISGNTPITLTPSATLAFRDTMHEIVGNIPISLTPSASMLYVLHNYSETVSDVISTVSTTSQLYKHICVVSDTLSVSSNLLYSQINTILESINLLTTHSNTASFKSIVLEHVHILDLLLNQFKLSITENISCASTVLGIINQIEIIIEHLPLLDDSNGFCNILSIITDSIQLLDSVFFGLQYTISESIVLNESISNLSKLFNTVLNTLILDEDLTSTYIHIVSLSEQISIDCLDIQNTIVNNILTDSFIISVPTSTGPSTYLAYAFNTETNSVSTYTNYSFNCSTLFNGEYLLGNSSGLYKYGGKLDDTALIEARLKTVAYDFGTSNLKQIPDVYIGGANNGPMVIKVNVDNNASVYYRLLKNINNLNTKRVKLGKGLIGRYFQFELITSATDSDLESIEFYPIVLHRKI